MFWDEFDAAFLFRLRYYTHGRLASRQRIEPLGEVMLAYATTNRQRLRWIFWSKLAYIRVLSIKPTAQDRSHDRKTDVGTIIILSHYKR